MAQYSDNLSRAFEFAFKAHAGSCRKGTQIPYIVHPLDVATNLMKNEAPEHVVMAGFLHDVVEDTDIGLDAIETDFGATIAELVNGASEPEDLKSAPGKGASWKERKSHTIAFITDAGADMKLLSCADKLSNIRDMIRDHDREGDAFWDRFNAPFSEQSWYYHSMADAFAAGPDGITDRSAYGEFKRCVETLFGAK